jgi:hypothetical protein
MLSILTSVVIVTGFTMSALFVLAYLALARWWRNPAGRALMMMAAGMGLMLLPLMLVHPFGLSTTDSTVFSWVQIGCVTVGVGGMAWMLAVLVRAQVRGRKDGPLGAKAERHT